MDIHAIVQQSECRIFVSNAVELTSLACLAAHIHLKIALPIVLKLRDVLPFEVLRFCAMPHACIGHDQLIVSQ